MPLPSGNSYLFYDGGQLTVRGNKLYAVDLTELVIPHNPEYLAFIGTMLSSNIMSLHFVGELDDFRFWIRDYTFERR